jgi:carbon storage regulator
MLILGRREKEDILIGEDIRVSIESISKGMVKVGIEAPKDVVVLRGELKEKIADTNKLAAKESDEEKIKEFGKLLKDD